jgi:hypothetical protein
MNDNKVNTALRSANSAHIFMAPVYGLRHRGGALARASAKTWPATGNLRSMIVSLLFDLCREPFASKRESESARRKARTQMIEWSTRNRSRPPP